MPLAGSKWHKARSSPSCSVLALLQPGKWASWPRPWPGILVPPKTEVWGKGFLSGSSKGSVALDESPLLEPQGHQCLVLGANRTQT